MREETQRVTKTASGASAPEAPAFPVLGRRSEELLAAVRAFARVDETMLLSGPSGAGKTRLAALCHAWSARSRGPFQLVDLLSVPEEMQMAELFGWRRGAFTGAVRDHAGFVAGSNGGTLFIDEIDKLSLRTQAGLLNFMESKTFRALGDAAGFQSANVRLIVATNVNLRERVRSGAFREDLYFRISVLPIRVPPLSERADEIVPWARYMLERCHEADVAGHTNAAFHVDAEEALARAEWPGNLRQLDNVVRRAHALARAEHSDGTELVVSRRHLERALSCDPPAAGAAAPLAALRRAADEFFSRVVAGRSPGALRLSDARVFEGLVLEAGLRRLGDLAEVYRMLGAQTLVDGRNHHRHFRRELERVARLERAVWTAGDSRPPGEATARFAGEAQDEVESDVDGPRFELRRA